MSWDVKVDGQWGPGTLLEPTDSREARAAAGASVVFSRAVLIEGTSEQLFGGRGVACIIVEGDLTVVARGRWSSW